MEYHSSYYSSMISMFSACFHGLLPWHGSMVSMLSAYAFISPVFSYYFQNSILTKKQNVFIIKKCFLPFLSNLAKEIRIVFFYEFLFLDEMLNSMTFTFSALKGKDKIVFLRQLMNLMMILIFSVFD